jgi:hypothetical protein
MNYKFSSIRTEEVHLRVIDELSKFYRGRLEDVLDALVKAQTRCEPMDFRPLRDLIVEACDNECITAEEEGCYNPALNLFA